MHPDETLAVAGVDLERGDHLWGWVSVDVTNRSGEMLKWKDIHEKLGCVSDVLGWLGFWPIVGVRGEH